MDLGLELWDLDYILQTATVTERGFVGNVRQRKGATERRNDTVKERLQCSVVCVCACQRDICVCVCVCKAQWRVAVKFGEGVLAGPHADFLA